MGLLWESLGFAGRAARDVWRAHWRCQHGGCAGDPWRWAYTWAGVRAAGWYWWHLIMRQDR